MILQKQEEWRELVHYIYKTVNMNIQPTKPKILRTFSLIWQIQMLPLLRQFMRCFFAPFLARLGDLFYNERFSRDLTRGGAWDLEDVRTERKSRGPISSVIGKVQCLREERVKQWHHQGVYQQRARHLSSRRANSVTTPSISVNALVLMYVQNCMRARSLVCHGAS